MRHYSVARANLVAKAKANNLDGHMNGGPDSPKGGGGGGGGDSKSPNGYMMYGNGNGNGNGDASLDVEKGQGLAYGNNGNGHHRHTSSNGGDDDDVKVTLIGTHAVNDNGGEIRNKSMVARAMKKLNFSMGEEKREDWVETPARQAAALQHTQEKKRRAEEQKRVEVRRCRLTPPSG